MTRQPPALTVLRLHPDDPATAATWRDTHLTHAKIMEACGGHQTTRILWARPNPRLLLVQADQPVTTIPGTRAAGTACRPVRLDWPPGHQVAFGLIGNPTMRPADRTTARNRVPLPAAERDGWLLRKLAGALTVTGLTGSELGGRTGRRPGGPVRHVQHAWTGRATVDNPAALAELIAGGVGPAKGYGCGLLIVRDAP
ncbi:MAG TPA: type I-E CRISPR-associated protein Cas6/Cse3/CasE [Streptomyces sp.]